MKGSFFPSILLSHARKKLDIFSILVWHWCTVTKISFVCRTESLRQTKLVYVAQKNALMCPKLKKNTKMAQKLPKKHTKCKNYMQTWLKSETFLSVFGSLLATYTNLVCVSDSVQQIKKMFVAVTHCYKQNKSVLQWLSATNNIGKKNIQFLCGMWHMNWKKKAKNKHNFIFEFHHPYQIALGALGNVSCIIPFIFSHFYFFTFSHIHFFTIFISLFQLVT